MDPRRIVREGYDEIASRFADWNERVVSAERDRLIDWLLERLPEGARVLDLGCGNGWPVTERLATRFDVTGVDISGEQIARARERVPTARFMQADMTGLDLPDNHFDAVVAAFSIIHLPRDEHAALFASVARWLRSGGCFIFSTGVPPIEAGYEDDWLGAPMFWSHHDLAETRRLIECAGFDVVDQRHELVDEDGTAVPFVWLVCRASSEYRPGP